MDPRALRIVHIISSLECGGMERFVLRLATAQRKRGQDASILGIRGGPLDEQAAAAGVPVHVIGRGNIAFRVAKQAAMMARLRPDVVHAHNPTSMHYALLGQVAAGASRRLLGGAPLPAFVVTDHRGIYRTPTRFEWSRTDAVVAVSDDTAKICGAVGKAKRIVVIENGIEAEPAEKSRDDVRRALGLGEGPVCITVANLLPVKNHSILVKALARLRDAGVALTAVFVGQGSEREAIETLAADRGLGPDRLKILGFRTDIPDLLHAADIFVLASQMEGLPLAILEAMSTGLPIVATAVGGIPEVVRDGVHGLLVPPGDPAALASAIGKLTTDEALRKRLGEQASARARDDFSFDTMTRKYHELYMDILAGRARGRG